MHRAFRPVHEVANKAGLIWTKAEHRLGEEQRKTPKATGTRGQLAGPGPGRGKTGSTKTEPPVSDTPTLAEKGLDKKRSARAQKLAEIGAEKANALADALAADGKAVSPSAILAARRGGALFELFGRKVSELCQREDCVALMPRSSN